tara:strand:+ start:342 stop:581 length:240 start_codon:yes stop_codon:yes gene_type:complete
MNFTEIEQESIVYPGEYLLYSPDNKIVVCGAFNREHNYIRAFGDGKYVQDEIPNFRKIQIEGKERKKMYERKRCTGCKG